MVSITFGAYCAIGQIEAIREIPQLHRQSLLLLKTHDKKQTRKGLHVFLLGALCSGRLEKHADPQFDFDT